MSLVINLACMGCIAASALSAAVIAPPSAPALPPAQIEQTTVTASTTVALNPQASYQVETLTVYGDMGYWKIHVVNNSKSTTRLTIHQGSPRGEQVGDTLLTPAGAERSFTSPEGSPLPPDVYYLSIQTDGNHYLSGAVYYKFSDTDESLT